MRELTLVRDGSTPTSLVLEADSGEQFVLPVTDTLREMLGARETSTGTDAEPQDSAVTVVSESKPTAEPVDGSTPRRVSGQPDPNADPATPRQLPEPDPLQSTPLSMRPREIQMRIRAGASVEELAADMGVAASRVEPYAHPVLLERAQITELARSSHPVREDGPAKLTLAEVLAAAFGARGHSLSEATWDAFKEPDGEWVIRVRWQAGLSENEAEWTFHRHSTSSSTAEPRNAVAADLTDPDFVQPVRSLTSVSRGTRYEEPLPSTSTSDDEPFDQELEYDGELDGADADDNDDRDTEEFPQHPGEEERPAKASRRRRKAVTPHWEDVLLGVRTNTKRPRK
ncbi:DUF3071 domain-containing protein [Corynebacterium yudongzhengii]|uniref:DUF3071 domain-containing protein n=1 Tax=Corynebacterium yudongzhengii TaxID=2080740 RepID=A0A2U1T7P8_9CORY|nr:septation protein SepH [Corynebacterium yudongzhengii]AWB82351.1 DUF3071 domain-containing protein [Corynebacterium yudongzhengii]PWC02030.1 DUF3071 domain-containing protein [Corynebacterium yudongzhengii]